MLTSFYNYQYFFLLSGGIYFVRRKEQNVKMHRSLMLIAVILNAISIILVMGRVFITEIENIVMEFYEFTPLLMWTHGLTGGLAQVLGISFLFKHPPKIR